MCKKLLVVTRASLLGARTLLVALGLTTRNKRTLLVGSKRCSPSREARAALAHCGPSDQAGDIVTFEVGGPDFEKVT